MLCLILILAPSAPLPDGFVDREVLPILKQHCGKCHLDGKSKGGLSLSNQQSLDEGGDSGPAVDAKTPRNGLLAKVLRYDGEMKMPPTGKLPPQQLEKPRIILKCDHAPIGSHQFAHQQRVIAITRVKIVSSFALIKIPA